MTSNEDWYQIAKNFKIDEIPYENFSKGLTEDNELGSGAFGIVYKTTCEPIGLVAIKKIHHADDVKKIINEVFNQFFFALLSYCKANIHNTLAKNSSSYGP